MGLFSKTVKPVVRLTENLFNTPAVVLLYHRVDELQADHQQLAVSPKHFDEQLSFLKENYNLVTIEEFYDKLSTKTRFDPHTVILTFDDGYADNYIHALPILEKHGTQALFYITTSKLNTNEMLWWDALEYIFFKVAEIPVSLSITINGKGYAFDTTHGNKARIYKQLHPLIKYTHYRERDRVMKILFDWAKIREVKNEDYRLLTHHELKTMAQSSSCIIGAHTVDHPVLSKLSFDEQYEQMMSSKNKLEELTGKHIIHFSYPFGSKVDYNNNSIKACEQAGFDMVTSNFEWQVHTYTGKFEIPRYLVRDWDLQMFGKKMKTFFTR